MVNRCAGRLLVVEDEPGLADSLRQGLTAEGFKVDVATDGVDGLALATRGGYAAIVLDVLLPGITGDRICAKLRDLNDWTPVLMLTAQHGAELEVRALDSGADDFLAKPFSFLVLRARIRALLRRRERAADGLRLEVGELSLDPIERTVRAGEASPTITPTEFDVLQHLMRHAGQVVSRRQLLDAVWDVAYDGAPNIVEVYISSLRRKLDPALGRRVIRTVRGAGYRLVD